VIVSENERYFNYLFITCCVGVELTKLTTSTGQNKDDH